MLTFIQTGVIYLYYWKLTTVPSKKCGSVLTNPDFFTRDRSKIPGNIDNTGLYEFVSTKFQDTRIILYQDIIF